MNLKNDEQITTTLNKNKNVYLQRANYRSISRYVNPDHQKL